MNKKMDASKENAVEAAKRLDALVANLMLAKPAEAEFLYRFLKAANKRLPSQRAIDNERKRRKKSRADRLAKAALAGLARAAGIAVAT